MLRALTLQAARGGGSGEKAGEGESGCPVGFSLASPRRRGLQYPSPFSGHVRTARSAAPSSRRSGEMRVAVGVRQGPRGSALIDLSPRAAEWLAPGSSSLTRSRSLPCAGLLLRAAPALVTWLGAEGGGAASFLSGRGAQSRWLGQAAPRRVSPCAPLSAPGGSCSPPKRRCCLRSWGPASVEAAALSAPRRSGKSPRHVLASSQRGAGSPLLSRHAEPNPDRKAEQTPERRGPRPPPPPPKLELRPSPNFPAAAPLASRPAHEYLYGADSVSALGRARQSSEKGRSLRAPKAQPSLRRSECPHGHARCLPMKSFDNLGIDRRDEGFATTVPTALSASEGLVPFPSLR